MPRYAEDHSCCVLLSYIARNFCFTRLLLFCRPTSTLFLLQLRGLAMPASDLQSQLNDMLDDSASDTSSIPQNILALSPPLRTAPTPFASPGPQAGVPGPKLAMSDARMQQMVAMPGANDDFEGMQMKAQGVDSMQQQQISELQGQLQVSCTFHFNVQTQHLMKQISCCFKNTASGGDSACFNISIMAWLSDITVAQQH